MLLILRRTRRESDAADCFSGIIEWKSSLLPFVPFRHSYILFTLAVVEADNVLRVPQ